MPQERFEAFVAFAVQRYRSCTSQRVWTRISLRTVVVALLALAVYSSYSLPHGREPASTTSQPIQPGPAHTRSALLCVLSAVACMSWANEEFRIRGQIRALDAEMGKVIGGSWEDRLIEFEGRKYLWPRLLTYSFHLGASEPLLWLWLSVMTPFLLRWP